MSYRVILVLGTKAERSSQDFSKFIKALHNHVNQLHLSHDPMKLVIKDLPTTKILMQENYLESESVSDLEDSIKFLMKEDFLEVG